MAVSVIIPMLQGEKMWRPLLEDLCFLSPQDEVIVSSPYLWEQEINSFKQKSQPPYLLRSFQSQPGRARQLNAGIKVAQNDVLWILHSDSRVSAQAFHQLALMIMKSPQALFYFDLKFTEGPWFMKINEWGVQFRSRILGLPFGDQGFCLSKETFRQLGGFDERAFYGEDHLLVWKAHQQNVPVLPVKANLKTSARRYQTQGWLRTTLRHLILTARQAIPQFIVLLKTRGKR